MSVVWVPPSSLPLAPPSESSRLPVKLQAGWAQYSVLSWLRLTQLSTWQALASTMRASSVTMGRAAWAAPQGSRAARARRVGMGRWGRTGCSLKGGWIAGGLGRYSGSRV